MVVQRVGLFCGCRGRKSDGSAAGVWVVIGWLGAACDCLVWLGVTWRECVDGVC